MEMVVKLNISDYKLVDLQGLYGLKFIRAKI